MSVELAESKPTSPLAEGDAELLQALVERLQLDLERISERKVQLALRESWRADERAAGEEQVHLSFRLVSSLEGHAGHGCLLVPLPDALTLIGCFRGMDEDEIFNLREVTQPETHDKLALLEYGEYIAGALDAAMRESGANGDIRFAGCQGVRADVRPAFPHQEGAPLLCARLNLRLAAFDSFDALLMLP